MKKIAIVFLLSLALALPMGGCTSKDADGRENGAEERSSSASTAIVRGETWEQMLRNARVHDTDGDLTDLENAHTPGSLLW